MKTFRFLLSRRVYAEMDIEAGSKDAATEELLEMKTWEMDWLTAEDTGFAIDDVKELLEDEDEED